MTKKSITQKKSEHSGGDDEREHHAAPVLAREDAAPVVGEVEPERDQDAEHAAEHAALAHVEPGALTFTIETAPKLWKYMFAALSTVIAVMKPRVIEPAVFHLREVPRPSRGS
jgi:hypothetical protein